jgi:hypothetical protein
MFELVASRVAVKYCRLENNYEDEDPRSEDNNLT